MISWSQSRGIPLWSWTPRIWISTQQVGSCHLGETSEVVYVFVDDLLSCSKGVAKLGQSFLGMEFLGNGHRPIIVNHGSRCLFKYPGQQRPELIQYRRIGLDYIHLRYYVRILDIRWKSWCIWEHRWKTQLEPAAQEASLWRLCSHLFASTISSPGCAGSETFSWSQQEMLEIGFKWWNMWRLWLCCFGHRKLQWEVYSWSLGDAEFYGPHPS